MAGKQGSRRRSKAAQGPAEEKQDRILESGSLKKFSLVSFEGICVHAEGRILDTNQALAGMTGFRSEELAGLRLTDLFAPEYHDLIREQVRSGREDACEVMAVHRNKTSFPVEIQGKNFSFDGHVIRLLFVRDVAERNRAEELYRILTDKLQTGVYIVQNGKLRFVNTLFEEFTGYGREEVLGKSGLIAVHPQDRNMLRMQAKQMLAGERTSGHEYRIVTKNGHVKRAMGMVTPILFNNRPAILGSGMDVTELREAQKKLEDLEALESLILDTIPHAVLGLENRRIIFANNAVHDVFGWEPEELIGKSSRVLYEKEKDFRETGRLFYGNPLKRKIHVDEITCRRRDGTTILCALTASRLEPGGRSRKAVAVFEDVTERKRAELALVRERDFAESLIETAQAMVVVLDTEGRIIRFNPYTEDILGCPLEEVRGMGWAKAFIEKNEWPEVIRSFRQSLRKKETVEQTNTVITRQGQKRIVSWSSKTLRGTDGTLLGMLAVGRNVTEAKEAERKLSENYERMRFMSSELTRTEERERQQLATVLHDRIGQTMAVAKMKLEALQKNAGTSNLAGPLEEVLEIVDQLILDTRSLTFDLSPPVLYILGLPAALEWLAEEYQNKTGLKVQFTIQGQGTDSEALDKDQSFVLFRCAQELLMNVTKHARASRVLVSLIAGEGKTEIVIEDDGVGIDPDIINAPKEWTKGFGLFSIRERLSLLGGDFYLEPTPGGGTRTRMVVHSEPG